VFTLANYIFFNLILNSVGCSIISITMLAMTSCLFLVGDRFKISKFCSILAPYLLVELFLEFLAMLGDRYLPLILLVKLLYVLCIFIYVVSNYNKGKKVSEYLASCPKTMAKNSDPGRKNNISLSSYSREDGNNINLNDWVFRPYFGTQVWSMLWELFYRDHRNILYDYRVNNQDYSGSIVNAGLLKSHEWDENFEVCYIAEKPAKSRAVIELKKDLQEYNIINIILMVYILALGGLSFYSINHPPVKHKSEESNYIIRH